MTWLVLGLILGLLIAGLAYLKFKPVKTDVVSGPTTSKSAAVPKPQAPRAAQEKPIDTGPKKPTFDFYTMLPNSTSDAVEAAPAEPTTKPALPKPLPTVEKQYLLQVASLSQAEDADRIKAQLTLSGFHAQVRPVTIDQKTWYRVYLGPFDSLRTAKQTQADIKSNYAHSIIVVKKSA